MERLSNISIRQHYAREHLNLKGKGLEFGAYDRPLFGVKELNVEFADYYSTEELQGFAKRDNANAQSIVPVSHVIRHSEFAKDFPNDFDFVIGSHVIEHVPDTVRWLQNIEKILRPGGCAYFIVPDKRYTFDIIRPLTTLGRILENYIEARDVPSFSAAFDTVYLFRNVVSSKIWHGEFEALEPRFDPKKAFEIARDYYERKDASVHTHVFTHSSFLRLVEELRAIGLINLEIHASYDVYEPYNEFYIVLRAPG